MKSLSLFITSLLICTQALAQKVSIRGRFIESEIHSAPDLNIKLQLENGGPKVWNTVSDSSGFFHFNELSPGEYTLTVTSVGYESFVLRGLAVSESVDLGILKIVAFAQKLNEVMITSNRPPIEQKSDKTIVNIGTSLSSTASSILEVLERSPGVSNKGSSLTLRGKPGAVVMVDGKLQPLSGEDLLAFLKGMPAANVDKLELISSPSSKYDASGSGGIINIKTKKMSVPGINGTVNANFIQGKYARQNAGLSINRNAGKWNLQANYNFQNNTDFTSSDSYREFITDGIPQNRFVQNNFFKTYAKVHIGQLSTDYAINTSMQLGITGRIYQNDNTRYLDNINTEFTQGDLLTGKVHTTGSSAYHRFNPGLTLSYKYDINKSHLLTADIDVAIYQTDNLQESISTPLSSLGNAQTPIALLGNLSSSLKLHSAKADYQMKLKKFFDELSGGIKVTEINSKNHVLFENPGAQQEQSYTTDDNFLYRERIMAMYLNGQQKIGRLNFQLGLRFEHTYTATQQVSESRQYERKYGQLFPNLTINYDVNKKHSVAFLINRRIDRPTFRQLNPFRYYLNENTYVVGNPEIMPQVTTNIEISHTIAKKLTLRYLYSNIRDNMFTVLENDPEQAGVVRMIDRNLFRTHYLGIGASLPITVGNRYKGFYDINVFQNRFQGKLAGSDLNNSALSLSGTAANNFYLSPTWSAELSLNYKGRRRDALQLVRSSFAAMIALQKQFLEKKLNLRLTVSDVFNTNRSRFSTNSISYNDQVDQRFDTRLATVGITYRFGSGNPATGKGKRLYNDEVKQRAN